MDEELADPAAPPFVLRSGSPAEVDTYLVAALWHNPTSELTPAAVSQWATLLRRRGRGFASHASACHYWLYEKLSGNADELSVVLQTGSAADVDKYLVEALWHNPIPSLTPAMVSGWATLLRRRGIDFVSHASACHYWLYEELSGQPHEMPAGYSGEQP